MVADGCPSFGIEVRTVVEISSVAVCGSLFVEHLERNICLLNYVVDSVRLADRPVTFCTRRAIVKNTDSAPYRPIVFRHGGVIDDEGLRFSRVLGAWIHRTSGEAFLSTKRVAYA